MAEKNYYWLKLMKDFFTKPKIKKLRRIAGGDTYTIIYLKMQLLSLDNEAIIRFENIENTIEEEIALTIDEDVENVTVTLNYLLSQGLIEKISDNEYLLTETVKLIGSESSVAKRVRKYREKQKALQCNSDVTNGNIEIDKDKELDLELDKNKNNVVNDNFICDEKVIIDYLNDSTGKHFRHNTDKTKKLIKARIREGFTVDDFKKVIDIKVKQWGKDNKMKIYLRPETLFGNKFEAYLNEEPKKEIYEVKIDHEDLERYSNMEIDF